MKLIHIVVALLLITLLVIATVSSLKPLPSIGTGQQETIEFTEQTTSPNGQVNCLETTYKSNKVIIACERPDGTKPELNFIAQ